MFWPLVVLGLVVHSVPGPVFRPIETSGSPSAVSGGEGCDDGTIGGTLVQSLDAYYGNRFEIACGAGRLNGVEFVHDGHGLPGPYNFRVHLYDTNCTSLGVTELLTTAGAPDGPVSVWVDLADQGWCVGRVFYLFVEPLTCSDGLAGNDCFPALVVDASSDNDQDAHCAAVNVQSAEGRQCFRAQSADGRYFDFRMRVHSSCNSASCTTPVDRPSWSTFKRLYRHPTP